MFYVFLSLLSAASIARVSLFLGNKGRIDDLWWIWCLWDLGLPKTLQKIFPKKLDWVQYVNPSKKVCEICTVTLVKLDSNLQQSYNLI